MNRLRADGILLVAAILWGTAFVAQKAGNETMGPIAFVGTRFLLSALVLAPFAFLEGRRHSTPLGSRSGWLLGMIGVCLAVGACLQQDAMVTASATNAGFLTALYVVLVPFTTWLLTRRAVRPVVLAACLMSTAGAWLLTTKGEGLAWSPGDIQLAASAAVWAFWISLIGIFREHTNRPFLLAFVQFAITAALALVAAAILEPTPFSGVTASWPSLLYTGFLSGALAFTLQVVAQRYTPPAEAALIMSLESVFAAAAAAVLLHERLPPVALLGGTMILAGVIAAEIGPTLIRRKAL
jgi:drug/metabolite transporter (DMT)-like permease